MEMDLFLMENHPLNTSFLERGIKRVNMIESVGHAEVTGKAIRPKARGRGPKDLSLTAPSTPVHRGVKATGQYLRSGSHEQYSGGQSKSLEVQFKKKIYLFLLSILESSRFGIWWLLSKNKEGAIKAIFERKGLATG